MARVTVEDCVTKIPNCFELVMLAAQRVRQINAGAELKIDRENDKNTVVALREISEDKVSIPDLYESFLKGRQNFAEEMDDLDEEMLDIMQSETQWIGLESSNTEYAGEEDDADMEVDSDVDAEDDVDFEGEEE